MFDTILIIAIFGALILCLLAILLKKWDWLPILLLIILWYIPRQAVPDGILEDFVFLRWLTLLIIPVIMIIQILKLIMEAKEIRTTTIIWPLFAYVCFSAASGIMNDSKIIECVGSTALYIRYPLLFIALVNMDISKKTVSTFVKLLVFLVAIQIPECLYRFLALGIHGDLVSYTLGPWGQFDLGVYSIYVSAIIVAIGIVRGFKWYYTLFIILLIALALIGEIKALAFSIPVVSVAVIYFGLREQKIRKVILLIAVPLVLMTTVYVSLTIWTRVHTYSGNMLAVYLDKLVSFFRDPTQLIVAEKADYSASRFLGSAFVWNILKSDWKTLLFGMGPGSLLAGNFLGTPGRIFDEIPYLNQLAVILGEVGVVGVLIFYWLQLSLLRYITYANRIIEDSDIHIIAVALYGMWIFYAILGPFYDLVWRHDSPNFIFYFLLAYVYVHLDKVSLRKTAELQRPSGKKGKISKDFRVVCKPEKG
ncbi:MAG: hypothetical protein A2Y62_08365 [Candidatus Fischerbacteria bacterium RBG_13_37_8]|uniref:O-antigen polymerase n=1 Tax=Candidatus Fischerbacteria bacterium RBG_13_37_8 TaxID=1817863 RepID=A0A1F5VXL5_9BACT|nr:MAG: hypothetical protein A2Y62_08365 [Candidatus Fischerbacteria bacterium RBG_13_37_8]